MFKKGDILFFSRFKRSLHKDDDEEFVARGHCIGLLLGTVPPKGRIPTHEDIIKLAGTVGFFPFDDVIEFFGAEAGQEFMTKFEKKHFKDDEVQPTLIPHDVM